MNKTKPAALRLIELDRRIRDHEYPNCYSFAAEWGVSAKSVQRDVEYLRDMLKAPIEYDRARRGYHYTSKNWFLPALSMSEGELFALLVASRALEQYRGTPVAPRLQDIFAKIAETLPEKISLQPELIHSRFSFTGPAAKPVDERVWTALVRGLLRQWSVEIAYRAPRSTKDKERLIDPYHIACLQGEWYVFAYDHRAKDLSQFAIPRISRATVTKKAFEMPRDFDPQKLLDGTFGRFAGGKEVHEVRLVFDKEVAADVLERTWHPKQNVNRLADGRIELTFAAAGLFEVCRWVLAWGRYVQVVGPADLREMVENEVRAMASRSCP